jgi:glycine betaine catabolism B
MKVTRFARFTVFLNCAVPVILLGWDAVLGQLGANPVNFAIRTTGLLSLIFLVLSLLVTPASRIARWSWLGQFRRMLGLYAFFHGCLHFLIFFWFDRAASASSTLSEIVKRPYLMVGTLGLVLMVPLAVTSTDGMIKRLGGKRWKALHRLAYVVAVAGAVHYYMLVKADVVQPVAFAVALAVLLGYRLVAHYLDLRSAYHKLLSAPAATIASATAAGPTGKPKFWSGQLRVARVFDETPGVRTFRLTPPVGARLPFDFLPGQYLNLSLTVDGMRVNRSYTIASSPTRAGYCELTVKREERGVASRHLHDAIREGCLLDVSAPAGRFTFTGAENESIVMIAGGVGITPLMAKIRYLTDLSWPGKIHLLFAVKTANDIIFRDELDYLRRRFPNLHITVTVTRDDGTSWTGDRGRISPGLLNRVVPQISAGLVHICGPAEMTESTIRMLQELGVPGERIKVESFTSAGGLDASASIPAPDECAGLFVAGDGAEMASALTPVGAASITFARARKSKHVAARETILEASEDLGVDIAYDCRAGICGQCKTKLLSGRVMMDVQDALNPVDRANNVILSCQARCVDQVVVET